MIKPLCYIALVLAIFLPAIGPLLGNTGLYFNVVFILTIGFPILKVLWEKDYKDTPNSPQNTVWKWGISYSALLFLAVFRGYFSDNSLVSVSAYRMALYAAMIFIAMMTWHFISIKDHRMPDLFSTIVWLLFFYCAANLGMYILGIEGEFKDALNTTEPSTMLSWLNLDMNRVLFPMAWGVNNFSVIAGVTLTAGLIYFCRQKKNRVQGTLMVAVPTICCLMADSRAAVVCAVVSAVATLSAPKFSRWGLIAFWVTAAILISSTSSLETFTLGARSGQTTFTGREVIWGAAIAELSTPKIQHVFGYGQFGQLFSGVSAVYEHIFENFGDHPEMKSLHNTYLQSIMDTGYIGLFVMLGLAISAMKLFSSQSSLSHWPATAAQAIMMFLAANGLTEITMSIYQPWPFAIILAVMSLSQKITIDSHPGRIQKVTLR